MAKTVLPVNFTDDVLNEAMSQKRRYRIINNDDGTISLEDVTTYDQTGSNFGAAQINSINQAINESADAGKIIDDPDAIEAVTQEGYIVGALALKKMSKGLKSLDYPNIVYPSSASISGEFTYEAPSDGILRLHYGTQSTSRVHIEPTINDISIGRLSAKNNEYIYDLQLKKGDIFIVKFGSAWTTGIMGLLTTAFIPYL